MMFSRDVMRWLLSSLVLFLTIGVLGSIGGTFSSAVAAISDNGIVGDFNYSIDRENKIVTFTPKSGNAVWEQDNREWIIKNLDINNPEYKIILKHGTGGSISFPDNCQSLFAHLDVGDVSLPSDIDTSNVTNMAHMFFGTRINPDVSNWDTSNVTNMERMFEKNSVANPDVSKWDTSRVTNMKRMFYNSTANPDVSNWDTSKVTDISFMFSHSVANPDVSKWDTSNVTNMSGVFESNKVANPDVSKWDTANVTDMSFMFQFTDKANPDVSKWNTSNVTDMTSLFSNSVANPDVSKWNTSKVNKMGGMFSDNNVADPDVSKWDTSKVTHMDYMFGNADNANPDVSKWDTANVMDMSLMFFNAKKAKLDISNWNIKNILESTSLFAFNGVAGLGFTEAQKELVNSLSIPVEEGSYLRVSEGGFTSDSPNFYIKGYKKHGYTDYSSNTLDGLESAPLENKGIYKAASVENLPISNDKYYITAITDEDIKDYYNHLEPVSDSKQISVELKSDISEVDFKPYFEGSGTIDSVKYNNGVDTGKLGMQKAYVTVYFKHGTYYENIPVNVTVIPTLNDPVKTGVDDISALSDTEKNAVEVAIKAANPDAPIRRIDVADDGVARVIYDDGSTVNIPADKTIRQQSAQLVVESKTQPVPVLSDTGTDSISVLWVCLILLLSGIVVLVFHRLYSYR